MSSALAQLIDRRHETLRHVFHRGTRALSGSKKTIQTRFESFSDFHLMSRNELGLASEANSKSTVHAF